MKIKIKYVEQRAFVTEVEADSYTDAECIVKEYIAEHPEKTEFVNSVCYVG